MADAEDPAPPPQTHPRRSSFAGQTFADLFGTGRSNMPRSGSPPNPPGAVTQAAAQAQRRRLSLTTLGLSGSADQPARFNSYRGHRNSLDSANSGSIDESAIEDEPESATTPATSFGRRMSLGAKALMDARSAGGGGGSGNTEQNGTRSPPAASQGRPRAPTTGGTISTRDAKGRGLSSLHPNPIHFSHSQRHAHIQKSVY